MSDRSGSASNGALAETNLIHQAIINHPYISNFYLLFWVIQNGYPSNADEIFTPYHEINKIIGCKKSLFFKKNKI